MSAGWIFASKLVTSLACWEDSSGIKISQAGEMSYFTYFNILGNKIMHLVVMSIGEWATVSSVCRQGARTQIGASGI